MYVTGLKIIQWTFWRDVQMLAEKDSVGTYRGREREEKKRGCLNWWHVIKEICSFYQFYSEM